MYTHWLFQIIQTLNLYYTVYSIYSTTIENIQEICQSCSSPSSDYSLLMHADFISTAHHSPDGEYVSNLSFLIDWLHKSAISKMMSNTGCNTSQKQRHVSLTSTTSPSCILYIEPQPSCQNLIRNRT